MSAPDHRTETSPAAPAPHAGDRGPSLVVAIATYRRPHMLDVLLPLVLEQCDEVESSRGLRSHRVLVVDNDPEESARDTVTSWADRGVDYAPEHRPGIAAARNRALDEARGADLLVFIDDDEEPLAGWLDNLLVVWERWGCAAVAGPVLSRFETDVSSWVRHCPQFQRRTRPTGTVLPSAATGNLLLHLPTLERLGLRFDDRFGLTGGSDSLLTRTLARRGGEIRWSDESQAVETVPAARATRGWVLRRHLRTGNDWSRVHLDLATTRTARLRTRADLSARGVYRMLQGLLGVLRGLVTRDMARIAAGECDTATAVGVLRGAYGHVVTEYLRPGPTPGPTPGPIHDPADSRHDVVGGGPPPLRVCVGILTYRRPDQLATLLPQALEQLREAEQVLGASGEVLVVDNDPDASARPVCAGVDGVRYVHEPTSGIAAARHRALHEAGEAGEADLLQFIDDDEEPAEGWLVGMVRAWWEHGSPAAVAGSVLPRFARDPSSWIRAGGFFDRRQLPTGTEVDVAPAGNLLLDVRQLRSLGVQFDPSLGLRGGEDSLLTAQLTRAGGRIVFCRDAAIHDLVPAERSTRAWVLERSWHRGNTDSFLALHESQPGPSRWLLRGRLLAGGTARLVLGRARATLGLALRDERHDARGRRLEHKGRGMVRGATGPTAPQYARPEER